MNRLTIIGNLTRDPELRTTATGLQVCNFTVAVNRKKGQNQQQPDADFFRVTTWREQAENCARYLARGRKVAVTGPVSASAYQAQDGTVRANLEVSAIEVEFLTPRTEEAQQGGYQGQQSGYQQGGYQQTGYQQVDQQTGYQQVDMGDQLPF